MTVGEGDPGFTHWVPEADALVIAGDSHHKVRASRRGQGDRR